MSLIDKVKIKRTELLTILEANLEHHEIELEQLMVCRDGTMIDVLRRELDLLEKAPDEDGFQGQEVYKFPKPVDHSDDYCRAIRMVELTQDKVIELSEQQFDQLVMDNWHWQLDMLRTKTMYGMG